MTRNRQPLAPPDLAPPIDTLVRAVAEISVQMVMDADADELIERTVHLLQQQLGYDEVIVYRCGLDEKKFTTKFVAHPKQNQVVKSYTLAYEKSLAYIALTERRAVRIHDLAAEAPAYYQTDPIAIRAELHLPLERGPQVIGVLSLRSARPHTFDDHSFIILKTLAVQIAWTLEPSGPSAASETGHIPIKTSVHTILADFRTQTGIQDVFDRIVKAVVHELGYVGAMLAVLDEENQRLPVQALALNSFVYRLNLLERIEGLANIRVIGAYASLVDDTNNLGVQSCRDREIKISHNLYELFQPAVNAKLSRWAQRLSGVKTCISIPLLVGDRVVGNMYTATVKEVVSQEDIDALQLFVTNAAIAIHNTMLFEEVSHKLARREAELQQLRGIEKTINASVEDLEEVLKRILHGALELTKAEYGHVVLAGKYAAGSVDRVSYPKLPNKNHKLGITRLIMGDKKPRIINDVKLLRQERVDLKSLMHIDPVPFSKMRSQLGVPIISAGDELIGVINIGSQEANAFDEQSVHMLEQLAIQAAIAIKNAHQFNEQQVMQRQLASVNLVVAMGDIAGNMVHSINNWVGSIRADTKYLLRQFEEDAVDRPEAIEILSDMLHNGEATLTMAEKIRRPFQPVRQEPVDVNECLLIVLQAKSEALSDVLLHQELAELPLVEANQQLQLVFENLISNALQAMQNQERKKLLGLTTALSKDRQWIEVRIRDSGPGLPDHFNQNDIFKLGVTSRKEGMGYGLWWCDTFLKRLKGDIELVANSHKGCEFLVRLPISVSRQAEMGA